MSAKRGRPPMRWLSVAEAAERLDWDAEALHRLLVHSDGDVLPGASRDDAGAWEVPESALRRITGAGLFLFSFGTLAQLLDADERSLRRAAKAGSIKMLRVPHVGLRVPWSEYQRLTGRSA